MGEDSFGTDVGLAAEGGVAVECEVVVEAGGLGGGFFDEGGYEGGECFEISFTDFEVGMKADGVG